MSGPTFRPSSNFDAPRKMGGNEKFTLGCLGIILAPVILIVLFIIGGYIFGSDDSNEPNRFEAIRYCEDAVRDQLRSPSTAAFDSESTDSNPYRVSGTVDAENGFGATVRNNFSCTVTITGDSFSVTVDTLG